MSRDAEEAERLAAQQRKEEAERKVWAASITGEAPTGAAADISAAKQQAWKRSASATGGVGDEKSFPSLAEATKSKDTPAATIGAAPTGSLPAKQVRGATTSNAFSVLMDRDA